MRNYFLVVMAFLVGQVVQAEVVLQNYGGTNTTGGPILEGSFGQIIQYTAGTTTTLESVTLRIWNNSVTNITALSLNFRHTTPTGTVSRNAIPGTTVDDNGLGYISAASYGNFKFSLGHSNPLLHFAVTSGLAYSLSFELDYSIPGGQAAYWASTNQSLTRYQGWTGGDTTPATRQYSLSAVAVPEPGTMLLGGIAASAGAVGVWWKRRKQRRDAAALAAGDGA